jgi:hypothetical protein
MNCIICNNKINIELFECNSENEFKCNCNSKYEYYLSRSGESIYNLAFGLNFNKNNQDYFFTIVLKTNNSVIFFCRNRTTHKYEIDITEVLSNINFKDELELENLLRHYYNNCMKYIDNLIFQ